MKPPRRRQTIWTPDKSSRDGCSLPGVFCCSRKGQAIPRDGSGGRHRQAPGKPERNAVPRKGDTMGMARAGNWLPIPTARHHIFSVHTAASRGTAEFFYSTHFYLFPNKNTKRHLVLITGVPDTLPVRFFLRPETQASAALQGACAAAPVLKLFIQISRLEGI